MPAWKELDGTCVGLFPYTGYNRNWENAQKYCTDIPGVPKSNLMVLESNQTEAALRGLFYHSLINILN